VHVYAGQPLELAIGEAVGVAALFVLVRVAIYFALLPMRFAAFRRWRRELPFSLGGWRELVDSRHFASWRYWRLECKVTLTLAEALSDDAKRALDSVLFLFCKEANGDYYGLEVPISGFGSDPRVEWQHDGATLSGSVNTEVTHDLYKYLFRRLAVIARAHGSVTAVTIEVSPAEYELAPQSMDSEGTSS
jgi:hypothetical protein